SVFAFSQPEVKALRQLFFEARDSEKKADELYDKVGDYQGNSAILIAYKAGAHALKAKYGFNPMSKLKHVKHSQQYFSEAVQRDPADLEIRFMRYAVEVQTPAMLGYSEHVEEDKALLLKGLLEYPASGFTPETGRIARDFLRQHCACSSSEKEFLQQMQI